MCGEYGGHLTRGRAPARRSETTDASHAPQVPLPQQELRTRLACRPCGADTPRTVPPPEARVQEEGEDQRGPATRGPVRGHGLQGLPRAHAVGRRGPAPVGGQGCVRAAAPARAASASAATVVRRTGAGSAVGPAPPPGARRPRRHRCAATAASPPAVLRCWTARATVRSPARRARSGLTWTTAHPSAWVKESHSRCVATPISTDSSTPPTRRALRPPLPCGARPPGSNAATGRRTPRTAAGVRARRTRTRRARTGRATRSR